MRTIPVLCLALLTPLAAVAEPLRPPERGTIFIPFGRSADKAEPPAEARGGLDPTHEAAGPAEAALAGVEDAQALAGALRALVALDTGVVRAAPDMAAAVGAHLPRYRVPAPVALRDGPDGDVLDQLGADTMLILMHARAGWQEVYQPARHRIGWIATRRAAASDPD